MISPVNAVARRRRRPLLCTLGLALTAAACADDGPRLTQAIEPSGDVTIVGENSTFDVTAIDVEVGQPFTITFNHRDVGIQHNIRVQGTTAGDVATTIELGPVVQTLAVEFAEPGEHEYWCEVHADTMRGTVTVVDP